MDFAHTRETQLDDDAMGIDIGDVVYLNSDPINAMTVFDTCCDCGEVMVAWFDDNHHLHRAVFPYETLVAS